MSEPTYHDGWTHGYEAAQQECERQHGPAPEAPGQPETTCGCPAYGMHNERCRMLATPPPQRPPVWKRIAYAGRPALLLIRADALDKAIGALEVEALRQLREMGATA